MDIQGAIDILNDWENNICKHLEERLKEEEKDED